MWYLREKYKQGNVVVDYMAGVSIPADKLTKLGNRGSHAQFRSEILGLGLMPEYSVVLPADGDADSGDED